MASSDVPGIVSCEWLKDALDSNTPRIKVLDATWYSDKDAKQAYNEYVTSIALKRLTFYEMKHYKMCERVQIGRII